VDAFQEHHKLELEEDGGVDTGPSALRIAVLGPGPDKGEVELLLEMTVKVSLGDERLQRDKDGAVEVTRLGRTEHGEAL
jgi:hypothetical protein